MTTPYKVTVRPEISVVTACWRPGGMDLLMQGMHDQTFKNFEVIMVDRRYERRHKKVMEWAKHYGIECFYHVPEYKRNGKWAVLAASWNTGFMLAEAPVVIMLLDYAYAPPGWIERHLEHHHDKKGRLLKKLVMSPQCYLALPAIRTLKPILMEDWISNQRRKRECCLIQEPWEDYFDEMSIFHMFFEPELIENLQIHPPPDQDPKLYSVKNLDYKWMHMKNDSFSLESVIEVNGIDETFDFSKGAMDTEFGFRLWKYGCEVEFDRLNPVFSPNPRWIMCSMPFGDRNVRMEGRWSLDKDCGAYKDRRIKEIEDGAPPVAQNSYSLREKREELLRWKKLDVVPTGNLAVGENYEANGVKS